MGWASGLQISFLWDNVNNHKYVWIILTKMTFIWISQGTVATSDRWGRQITFFVKFSQDLTCQKLLKSVNFSQSYSKNKRWTFLGYGVEWLLVLACLVHQYSEICDLVSCPSSLSQSHMFVHNLHFGLHSDPFQYDLKKDLACMGDKSNCSVICTLFQITFLEKWDNCRERPFLWPLTSFPDCYTYSVLSVHSTLWSI